MTGPFIYDHVLAPRAQGRSHAALHKSAPIQLASQTLRAVRDPNNPDTALE